MSSVLQPAGGVVAPALIAGLYRAWSATWRVRRCGFDAVTQALNDGPVIFAFWHGQQMQMIRTHAHRGHVGLASQSRDGELLARIIARFGYGVIRGSSTRGGTQAVRGLIAEMQSHGRSPALAIDGPRGPRHTVSPGVVTLSALTRRPIVCVLASAQQCVRLSSWDAFEVPLPFARIDLAYAVLAPMRPGGAARAEGCNKVGAAMTALASELKRGPEPSH